MQFSTTNSEASSRNRKNKKPNMLRIVFSAVALIIFVYVIAAIIVTVNEGVSTTVALNGSVSDDIRTSGYVLKSQEIINAPSGGFLKCMVSEGERVKSGQVVAYIFTVEPNLSLVQNIKDIHRLLRMKSGVVDKTSYIEDGYSSTKAVSERVRNMSDLRKERNLSIIRDEKEALNDVLNKSGTDNDRNKTLDELNAELQALINQVGGGIEIKAPVAGVFSARIDGFEQKADASVAENVTVSYLNELGSIKLEEQTEILAGQPLCKIINNYNWSYVTSVDEKYLENVKVGQGVDIEFYDLSVVPIAGTISRISEAEGGKKAVVISTNKYVDGIYSTSCVDADIILSKAEGIKLPSKCIHVKDGVTGVFVLRLDRAQFVPVNVRYRNDDWTIVSAAEPELGGEKLRIYDEVIVTGKNIKDNELVR